MKRAFSKKNLWDKTPKPAKAFLGSALSSIPLSWILGGTFRKWHKFVIEADKWEVEQSREYQLGQLRRVLTLAYEKTEYYREAFQGIGFEPGDLKSLGDIKKLPTIDKDTVRENWQRMLTRPISDPDIDLVTTGGTSGEPLRFYMSSSRHALEFAHLTACWSRTGYSPGDSMGVLRGRVISRPTQGLYRDYDPLLRNHYYSTFHMSPEALRGYIEHLNNVKPKFLHAYPSSLYVLTKFSMAENLPLPRSIQGALLESEPLFAHQRTLIENVLGIHISSSYGLSEKVVLATECEGSSRYHVLPTYGYCEVVGHGDNPVEDGEAGELVGTGFIDTVMPLIRYRTGDRVKKIGTGCSCCGRQQLMFDGVQPRRTQEFLVCRDSRTLISMTSLNLHDDTFDGILRFQFVQDEPGKVELLLIPVDAQRTDSKRLLQHFAPKLNHGIDLRIRFVSEIPLTRVGKQPMILQRCKGIDDLLSDSSGNG